VRVKPHAIIVRITLDLDDANLLCQSDLRGLGARAFVARWALRHDIRSALARCVAGTRNFHPPLLERAGGTAAVTTTTTPAASTSTAASPLTVPSSISIQQTIARGRPLATGTSATTITANWLERSHNGLGGLCAAATGTTTYTGSTAATQSTPASPGTVTASLTGKLCENGKSGATNGWYFVGRYTITSGSGVTATAATTAAGHGRFAIAISPTNAVKSVAVGGLHS